MCKVCRKITLPFYGWIGYFGRVIIAGAFHSFYDHGTEWLLILCILCALANLPLDVYITYLYFFGKFPFLYIPELKVRLSFIGLALVTLIFTIIFIWSSGKGILLLKYKHEGPLRSPGSKNNQILPRNGSNAKVAEFESVESKEKSSEDLSSGSLEGLSKPDVNKREVQKIHPFIYFKLLWDCLFLLVAGPSQLYLVYFYIVRCIVFREMAVIAKLVIAGFLLPIFLTSISSKNIYRVLSRPWYSHYIKPALMVLALATVLAGIGSVWFSALSFYTMKTMGADPIANGQLEVHESNMEAQKPSILLIVSETSFHLVYAKEVMEPPHRNKSMKYKCSNGFQMAADLLCSEINFDFEYDPRAHRIVHDHIAKHYENTTSQVEKAWSVGWSCNLCLHDSALIAAKNITQRTGYRSSQETEQPHGLAACANIPDWLFYLLTGYTFLVTILFMALLTLAMMQKNKKETKRRLEMQEEAEKRFIRRLSSKISNDQQTQAPNMSPGPMLPSLAEELPSPPPPPRRTSASATTFRELARAAVGVQQTATGIALNQLAGLDATKLLSYSKPPRIIRVPKGTALALKKELK